MQQEVRTPTKEMKNSKNRRQPKYARLFTLSKQILAHHIIIIVLLFLFYTYVTEKQLMAFQQYTSRGCDIKSLHVFADGSLVDAG